MKQIVAQRYFQNEADEWCLETKRIVAGKDGEPLIQRVTIRWPAGHAPTADERAAAEDIPAFHRLQANQKSHYRRAGRLVLFASTGPPTFWAPRLEVERSRIYFGWLRLAVGVSLIRG